MLPWFICDDKISECYINYAKFSVVILVISNTDLSLINVGQFFFMSDSFPMHWWFQRLENDVWLCVITDQLRLLERHEMELLHRHIQILSNAIKIFKYKDFLCIFKDH